MGDDDEQTCDQCGHALEWEHIEPTPCGAEVHLEPCEDDHREECAAPACVAWRGTPAASSE